jgi:hypothetical protein
MDNVGVKEEGDMKKLVSIGIVTVLFLAVVTLAIPATAELTPETNDYTLIFYDGHMHTIFSDGNGTVSDIVATAKNRGLDAVIITDHSEDLTMDEWNWLVSNCSLHTNETFLCLPGFEMTGKESIFNRDHFNVYNVSSPFVTDELVSSEVWTSPFNPNGTGPLSPENLTNWVEWAHSQGGIVVHNHPLGHTKAMYGVDVIEIWNQDTIDEINEVGAALPPPLGPQYGAGYILNNLAIYGERDLATHLRTALHAATEYLFGVGIWFGSPEDPLNSWDSFLSNYTTKVTQYVPFAVGDTDSHNTGTPDSSVGFAKTGVYVQNLTANDLYEGIKNGNSFVTTGPIISFNISDVMMGETLFLTAGVSPILNIEIESSAASANITQVNIVKNGNYWWRTFNPNKTSFEAQIEDTSVATDSYYRIEVVEYDPILNETHYAYSNPIFVEVPIPGDVDYDGIVNIQDVVIAALAFGSAAEDDPATPWNETVNWNLNADLNGDGKVNIIDLVIIGVNFGKTE